MKRIRFNAASPRPPGSNSLLPMVNNSVSGVTNPSL